MKKIDFEKDLYSTYIYGLHNKYALFDNDNKVLASYIVPFIYSLDPISDFRIIYLKMIAYIYTIPRDELTQNRSNLLLNSGGIENYANQVQKLLRTMLDVALQRVYLKESDAENLERDINNSIFYKKLYWRGGEFTGYWETGNKYISMNLSNGFGEVPVLTLSSAKDMFRIIVEELAKAVCLGPDK